MSLTTQLLQEIRDEIRLVRSDLGGRIDETNRRLDDTNRRLEDTNGRLDDVGRRVVEAEVRTATAITDLAGTVHEMTTVLRAQHDLRPRVERCEHAIDQLRTRLDERA